MLGRIGVSCVDSCVGKIDSGVAVVLRSIRREAADLPVDTELRVGVDCPEDGLTIAGRRRIV
jgi:hypothetical protein